MNTRKIIFILLLLSFFFQIKAADAGFFKKGNKNQNKQSKDENNISSENDLKDTSQSEEATTIKGQAVYLELEGDNVEYDYENNIYITSGMSVAQIKDQDAVLEADKIIYFGNEKKIEATGNVKIIRQGIETIGELFNFDVNSNRYLLTNPQTVLKGALIKSREVGNPQENTLEYKDGELNLDKPIFLAEGFGVNQRPRTFYSTQIKKKILKYDPKWEDIPSNRKYRVSAKKIVYDNTKTIKNLTIYNARVNFDKFSLPLAPKITTTATDDSAVRSKPFLTPTIGTQGAIGGFALGPTFNINITDHYLLSLSPFGQIGGGNDDSKFGFGGKIALDSANTRFDFLYGSLRERFAGEFRQKFGQKTEFRGAYNKYLDGGFLGSILSEVNVGAVDRRNYNSKFLMSFTEGGLRFRTEGNWSQGDKDILPSRLERLLEEAGGKEQFENNAFKFEEQISLVSKPIIKLGTEKYNTALRFRTRNAFRAYSTGDLQGIFTGGPLIDNTLGPVSFELGYDQGFFEGKSPLFYDQYLEGMQSLSFDGDVKLCEYLSLGGYGTYNLKSEEVVQRQFRAKFGPKDFKLLVNFDSLRQQTQFGLNFLFGRPVDFERFVIINSAKKLSGM